jgi:hypothetical protein
LLVFSRPAQCSAQTGLQLRGEGTRWSRQRHSPTSSSRSCPRIHVPRSLLHGHDPFHVPPWSHLPFGMIPDGTIIILLQYPLVTAPRSCFRSRPVATSPTESRSSSTFPFPGFGTLLRASRWPWGGPPALTPAGAADVNKSYASCSSSHSAARLNRTGGGADSGIGGAPSVPKCKPVHASEIGISENIPAMIDSRT